MLPLPTSENPMAGGRKARVSREAPAERHQGGGLSVDSAPSGVKDRSLLRAQVGRATPGLTTCAREVPRLGTLAAQDCWGNHERMEVRPPASAVAYIRVSSKAQDLATQRAAIERAAVGRGDAIVHWYAEKASAKTIAREELQRLRADVRAGKVGRLYVYRLDRLARSGIRDTLEIVEELRAHKVDLVTISDGFDLNGPAAEVILAVMAWAAKMERLAINERISAARDRLAAEGRPWGRPSRFTATDRCKMAKLRDEGRSIRQIAMAVKAPRSSVALALRKPATRAQRAVQ